MRFFVFQSAMLLSDKSNYTFQLYQIFQQYPDTLLMAVFFSMRDDQMVSKIKSYVSEFPENVSVCNTEVTSVWKAEYGISCLQWVIFVSFGFLLLILRVALLIGSWVLVSVLILFWSAPQRCSSL